jgi:hypothetical protein
MSYVESFIYIYMTFSILKIMQLKKIINFERGGEIGDNKNMILFFYFHRNIHE